MKARQLTTSALIIAVVVTVVLSLLVCHMFVRNIHALLAAFRSIGEGNEIHK